MDVPALSAITLAIGCLLPDDVAVRVVDESHRPVANAWVAGFLASGVGFRAGEYGEQGIDSIQSWIERRGQGAPNDTIDWSATNAEGRATVAANAFWNDLVAVTPTSSGHQIFVHGTSAKSDVVEIVVRPHRFWRVPVVDGVDPKQRPIVSVEFGTESDLHSRDSFHRITTRTTAGADNVATLGPIDLFFDPLEIDPTLVARLDLPIEPAPRLRLRRSMLDQRELPLPSLVVPPHGSIEVRIVDQKKTVVTKPDFLVTVRRDPDARVQSIAWLNGELGTWRRVTKNGVADLDFVGLGAMLTLEGIDGERFRDSRASPMPFDSIGPIEPLTTPGERRLLTLPLPDPPRREVTIAGRVVGADKEALARHELSVEVVDPKDGAWIDVRRRDRWNGPLTTESDGAFHETLLAPAGARRSALFVLGDAGPVGRTSFSPVAAATFAIDDLATWNGGDLGTVTLEPLPLLASGRAVDDKGSPIAELSVRVDCRDEFLKPDPAVPRWWCCMNRYLVAKTSREGRFDLRGFGLGSSWEITADNVGYATKEKLKFVGGATDLVLPCEPGWDRFEGGYIGGIAGSLLLDPDVPSGVVEVSVDAIAPGRDRGTRLSGYRMGTPGDRFGSDSVPTGTWTVTVAFEDFGSERMVLATVPNVEVRSGRTTMLPPIDLRGRVKAKRLSLRDRAGDPILAGYVVDHRTFDPRQRSKFGIDGDLHFECFHEGESVVCAAKDWPELEFYAERFRRVVMAFDDARKETIVLAPGIPVHAVLPEGVRLPPLPLALEVMMTTGDLLPCVYVMRASQPSTGDAATVDGAGVADLRLPGPGLYSVTAYVTSGERRGGGTYRRTHEIHTQALSVADSDDPLRVDLEVTQDEVDIGVIALGF